MARARGLGGSNSVTNAEWKAMAGAAAGEVAVEAAGAAAVAELVMGAEIDHQGLATGRQ